MWLKALGTMEVMSKDRWVPVRAPKQRALLAILLAASGAPVSLDRLIDQLWGETPPGDPVGQVRLLVSRLRGLFGADVIETVNQGYRLVLEQRDSDVGTFDSLATAGSTALEAGEHERAAGVLRQALELWRGPAFADCPSAPSIESEADRLAERRSTALEACLEAELRLGRHVELIAELQQLVSEHPYRERLCVLLMVALYRSGRQVEALEVFQTAYRRFDEELGVLPGHELQETHRRILSAEPELPLPGDRPPVEAERARTESAPPPKPAQLPPSLSPLTGREVELRRVVSAADHLGRHPGKIVIGAIDGMAGVGKTALAVHAAHLLSDRFPDGQLFIDLHGFTPGVEPMSAQAALDRLLRAIGVQGEQIPTGAAERVGLWRSCMTEKRYLLLLDNAASADQVRPLLPPAADCLVLVTSRRRLGELEDAVGVSLDVLSVEDATTLLRTSTGPGRLDAEPPELVSEAVEWCGRLPLGIRMLAARLRDRPSWTLDAFLAWARERGNPAKLGTGRHSIAASFEIAYRHLDDRLRRLFRLLGLHPGADFDAHAAAALAGIAVGDAQNQLEWLADAHLLQCPAFGRFAFHDLIRAHAVETADRDESASARDAAMERLLSFYLSAAGEAMNLYAPDERPRRPAPPPVATATPSFDFGRATDWLDTELPNLVALADHAIDGRRPDHASRFSTYLHRYLENNAHYSLALRLHGHHLRAARQRGDRVGEARALRHLGATQYSMSDHAAALDSYNRALSCLTDADDRDLRARIFYNLGIALAEVARYSEAHERLRQALALYDEVGDSVGKTDVLGALAHLALYVDEFEHARTYARQGLELARERDDRLRTAEAYHVLGIIHVEMARYKEALNDLHVALELLREAGFRSAEGLALSAAGRAWLGLGEYTESLEHVRRALDTARDIGDRNGESQAHHAMAQILRASGRPHQAIEHLRRAVDLTGILEQPRDRARAHSVLGQCHLDLDELEEAREQWNHALAIYRHLGLPGADEVRARLDGLG